MDTKKHFIYIVENRNKDQKVYQQLRILYLNYLQTNQNTETKDIYWQQTIGIQAWN